MTAGVRRVAGRRGRARHGQARPASAGEFVAIAPSPPFIDHLFTNTHHSLSSNMASNNRDDQDRPHRDRDDQNNPFIAFRRFADSQVSSLLNTIVTLPATITNLRDPGNVHAAREQCLFGRADKKLCEELRELEEDATKLLSQSRDLFQAGDVSEALKKGEDWFTVNYLAHQCRERIVEGGIDSSSPHAQRTHEESNSGTKKLVERVANEKGQQWGWSWDWGFPRPFDAEEGQAGRYERCQRWRRRREESTQPARQADGYTRTTEGQSLPTEDNEWSREQALVRRLNGDEERRQQQDPMGDLAGLLLPLLNELVRGELSSDPTHPEDRIIEDMAPACGIVPRDAYEDLIRVQNGLPMIPSEQLGQSEEVPLRLWARRFWDQHNRRFVGSPRPNEYPKRVPWEDEETAEEPNYEYSHDHEDQHDEPPSPKAKQGSWSSTMPETELEAYERVLGPLSSQEDFAQSDARPSVLSTLTTTERTIAPDGTVTTKVVLKKRFADGREESSETVHTQRGQEEESHSVNGSSRLLDAVAQHKEHEERRDQGRSKGSGWFWSN